VGVVGKELVKVVVGLEEEVGIVLDTGWGSVEPDWGLGWDRDGLCGNLEEGLVEPVGCNESIVRSH
jgi:hypothetical protein